MYEVRELLDIGKGEVPAPPYEVDDIIAAGRRRRRRSTAYRIAGLGVAAVALVAVSLFLANPTLLSNDRNGTVHPARPGTSIVRVSIFLTLAVTPDQEQAIDARLRADPRVSGDPQFLDTQASYELFVQEMKFHPELIASVTPEQVPQSFRITLRDSTQFGQFVSDYRDMPGVDNVVEGP